MNPLVSLTVHEVMARVAAPTPTPGGGAVAAISGAFGTALTEMVAALPRTRRNAPEERVTLDQVRPALSASRARLETLADLDSEAFDRVLRSHRLPQSTAAEQAARRDAIAEATKDATRVPLETARVCADVLARAVTVAGAGNRAAMSDLLVAIGIVRAAAEGAAANVRANLDTLDDEEFLRNSTAQLVATLDDVMHSAHRALGALQDESGSGPDP